MTTPTFLQSVPTSGSAEVPMNENFESIEFTSVYGKRQPATSGLTWGYWGGRWGGFTVANGTLALTGGGSPTVTNYIVVAKATGVISVSTSATNWNNTTDYARVYKITTTSTGVEAVEDHRAGANGVFGGGGGGSVPDDVLVFRGVIDCSANPDYPAADAGDVYKVSVAGKIGGASGPNVEDGDTLYCVTDASASGNHATVGANWVIVQSNVDGAVIGPASASNNNVALFDGTSGKLIKQSTLTALLDQLGATQGDILYRNATAWVVLGAGTAGHVLTTGGAGANPSWAAGSGSVDLDGIAAGNADATLTTTGGVTINSGTGAANTIGKTITIKPGAGGATNAAGGPLELTGGDGVGTGNGGTITVTGGTAGNTGAATGGAVTLQGGTTLSPSQTGGAATLQGGTGASVGGSNRGPGGAVNVTGGSGGTAGTGSASGGAVNITGGAATAASGAAAGGAVNITGGASQGSTAGATVTITGGAAAAGQGGGVTIATAPNSSNGSNSGAVSISTANCVSINGTGGAITVQVGTSTSSNTGGAFSAIAGGGGSSGAAGGTALVRGGTGGGTGAGGAATLQGGNASGAAAGGAAIVQGGTAAATAGSVGGAAQVLAANGTSTGTGAAGGAVAVTAGNAGGSGNNAGGDVTVTAGTRTGTGTRGSVKVVTDGVERVKVDGLGNVINNNSGSALTTSATDGFLYIPTCAGTPTGVPAQLPTGSAPMVFDSTNLKLYVYTGGAWKGSAAFT